MDIRGGYRFSSLVKQKKEAKICFVIHIAGEKKIIILYLLRDCEAKNYIRSSNHCLCVCVCVSLCVCVCVCFVCVCARARECARAHVFVPRVCVQPTPDLDTYKNTCGA